MAKMSTGSLIVVFVIILTTRCFVQGWSAANAASLTCREVYINALGRHCGGYPLKKRNTAQAPMPGAPIVIEDELDYSDIIGLAINHADAKAKMPEMDAQLYSDFKFLLGPSPSGQDQNPLEEHTMFYKENYPIFQQPRINPLSEYFNSFGVQQPQQQQQQRQQQQQPPLFQVALALPAYAAAALNHVPVHPRIRRMYDTGTQLVRKCCGKPISCYERELALLVHNSLCV